MVRALAVDPAGVVYAAAKTAVVPFDQAGKPRPAIVVNDPKAILFDRDGHPLFASKEGVTAGSGTRPLTFAVPKPDGVPRPLDGIEAAAALSNGQLLVSDKYQRSVGRFSPTGRFEAPFATVNAVRLAVDSTDRVVALDADDVVWLLDVAGKPRGKIANAGTGYQLDRPVDVAVDALGHVYVLDRGKATVFVFTPDPQPRLLTAFTLPQRAPGSFKKGVCLAVDPAGRLFIYDDAVEQIQVYQ